MWEFELISFGIIGGLIAGLINTISGSGSIITLSLMAFFGIPLDVANGTNRIGILTHGIKSSYSFHQRGELELKKYWPLILICIAGAIGGTITALLISNDTFNLALGFIFLLLLLILIFEPQKRIKAGSKFKNALPYLMFPIGFYGGFIQVATGIFLLTILHVLTGKKLQSLNPIKVFIIMLFNIPALLLFIWGGKINWELGIALAVGQYFGALFGVKINSTKRNIEPILKTFLIVLILISIGRFWGWY